MHALNEYVEFLWVQLQYDWSIMTNPWVLYPVLPVVAYLVFFFFKWFVLLAPITIPCSILSRPRESQGDGDKDAEKKLKKELKKLFHTNRDN